MVKERDEDGGRKESGVIPIGCNEIDAFPFSAMACTLRPPAGGSGNNLCSIGHFARQSLSISGSVLMDWESAGIEGLHEEY